MKPTTKSAAALEIAQGCLAARMRILNRVTTGIYDDALRPLGLRISQVNILVVIATFGPVKGVDVCRLLKLEKSTLSRDLQRLVEKGWVTAEAAAGNAQHLTASPAGVRQLEVIRPAWRKAQKAARTVLTAALADEAMAAVDRLWRQPAN